MKQQNLEIQLGELDYDKQNDSNIENGIASMRTQEFSHDTTKEQQGQKKKKYSSKKDATINLFKGYIGSGILALPFAFDQVGYVLGTICFILVAIAIYYTMTLIFQVADKNTKKGMGYPELAEQLLGAKGVLTVKVMLCLFQIGCCVSYVIFFLKFFEYAFQTAGNKMDDLIYLFIALCIILPLSLINDVSFFKRTSIIGNAFVIGTLILIYVHNLNEIFNGGDQIDENSQDLFSFLQIPMIIGTSIYSFEAIGLVFSIRNSLRDPTEFKSIFRNVNIFVCVLYISFAICGVVALGNQMEEIILFSMPRRFYVQMFQILYAIALILSYPLQLLPSYQIMEASSSIKNYIKRDTQNWKLRRFFFRCLITVFICISAFVIPRFAVFLNLIGSIAGTCLQFIFPILMYNRVYEHEMTKQTRFINKFVLIFGSFGGFCGFAYSVYELVNPAGED
ncbi:hypothetical protein PPERSA_01793 [Pseudocohnilembus persalinus]|uniref:Amino acid transporter transmembrane domain-containing protein n=1 Tax=Pseudocohnilembus persalinus TaxID=266149 RepID=A0A0V0R1D8_PSEPJ|nr:hypothetical protein PPERSA_01793 [Pseudocohnilembus persalinus]|eukprot:KRX08332.1 hypothetical protein PPERSA_01793 [Pseudocohnilembus persalinus]